SPLRGALTCHTAARMVTGCDNAAPARAVPARAVHRWLPWLARQVPRHLCGLPPLLQGRDYPFTSQENPWRDIRINACRTIPIAVRGVRWRPASPAPPVPVRE